MIVVVASAATQVLLQQIQSSLHQAALHGTFPLGLPDLILPGDICSHIFLATAGQPCTTFSADTYVSCHCSRCLAGPGSVQLEVQDFQCLNGHNNHEASECQLQLLRLSQAQPSVEINFMVVGSEIPAPTFHGISWGSAGKSASHPQSRSPVGISRPPYASISSSGRHICLAKANNNLGKLPPHPPQTHAHDFHSCKNFKTSFSSCASAFCSPRPIIPILPSYPWISHCRIDWSVIAG